MGCVMAISKRIDAVKSPFDGPAVVCKSTAHIPSLRKSKHLGQNLIGFNSSRDINDFYEIEDGRVLGTGVSGSVRVCVHKATKLQFALKRLSKLELKPEKLEQLRLEIAIMTDLDHPNILRLLEYFETDIEIFLILEICRGGELLDRLHEQADHRYPEKVACKLVFTMLSAVRYCHSRNIVHRDLKLENFLFESTSGDSQLKLIDFGLSQHFEPDEILHRAVGTPYYVSPEVLAGSYNSKCDIWSIGVIAYMLLSGVPPFYGPDDKATLQAVREGKWRFFNTLFSSVSQTGKDFITTCLDRQINSRPSALMAMKHEWFKMLDAADVSPDISLHVVECIRGFERRSTLSKVCMEVLSHNLSLSQIEHLHVEFMKIDRDKIGEISLAELRKVMAAQVDSGDLTDEDVRRLFVGINFDQTGVIQYHEFLAATISRKSITEENMKVAFERISSCSQYITGEDLCEILGLDVSSELVESMMYEIRMLPGSRLDFKHFKRIMLSGISSPQVKRRAAFNSRNNLATLVNMEGNSFRTAAITQASRMISEENSTCPTRGTSSKRISTKSTIQVPESCGPCYVRNPQVMETEFFLSPSKLLASGSGSTASLRDLEKEIEKELKREIEGNSALDSLSSLLQDIQPSQSFNLLTTPRCDTPQSETLFNGQASKTDRQSLDIFISKDEYERTACLTALSTDDRS